MATYLGPLGSLLRVKGVSAQPVTRERPMSGRLTLGGKRKGFLGVPSRREWAVDINVTSPADLAGLAYLSEFGQPPFVWLAPEASVVNVFSPRAAALHPGTYLNATEGALVTLPGGIVAKSVNPNGAACTLSVLPGTNSFEPLPVVPGLPVTTSIQATGSGVGIVLGWRSLDGTVLGTAASPLVTSSGWRQVAFTATPPAVAAYLTIQVVGATSLAAPALSYSDRVLAYGPGAGCPKAMISGLSEALHLATTDSVLKAVSFTVLELG